MSDWLKGFADKIEPTPAQRLLDAVEHVPGKQPEPEHDPTKKDHKFRPPEPSRDNQPSMGPGFKSGGGQLTQAQREAQEKRQQELAAAKETERQRLLNVDPMEEARRRIAEKQRTQEPIQLDKVLGRRLPGIGEDGGRKL